jgi:hypothetical protein
MSTGLGCRSAAYIIYAGVSTLVWIMMLVSSIFAHASRTTGLRGQDGESQGRLADRSPILSAHGGEGGARTAVLRFCSIVLRRLGKVIATLNAIGILVTCIFQFSNFFDRCFCNSSVFGLGKNAYNVIILTSADVPGIRGVWIAAFCLGLGSSAIYFGFVNIFINPPLPA